MCAAPKAMVFYFFWSQVWYRFNHLELKSGKVLYTRWNPGLELGTFFTRCDVFDVIRV